MRVTNGKIERLIDIINEYDLDVNYGLPPNSFGFTFIVQDGMSKKIIKEVDDLLSSLNNDETKILKEWLY